MTLNVTILLAHLKAGEIQAAIDQLEPSDGVIYFSGITAEDIVYDLVDDPDDLTKEQMEEISALAEEALEDIAEQMHDSFAYGDFGLHLANAVNENGIENPFDEDMNDEDEDDEDEDDEQSNEETD